MNHETLPAQGPVDVDVSRQCTCHPDDNPPQPCEHRYAFRDCEDAAEERYLRGMLAMLQESYAKAAEPYIKRLVLISNRRPPAQIVIPVDQAQALGLLPANDRVERPGAASCDRSARTTGCAPTMTTEK